MDPAVHDSLQWGTHCHYLQDECIDLSFENTNIKLYGTPRQPFNEHTRSAFASFASTTGNDIGEYWQRIPSDTDVLVVHGPPYGHGDQVWKGEKVGCPKL